MIITIICCVVSALSLGFGIYSIIRVNNTLSTEHLIEDEGFNEDVMEPTYRKPSSAEEIESVSIAYNDQKDYIDFYNDNEGVEYYTYDDDDEYVGETSGADNSELIKYVFEKSLPNLPDEEPDFSDSDTWSIEITSTDGANVYTSGTGEYPEWFKALLDKLDAKNKGFKSQNI